MFKTVAGFKKEMNLTTAEIQNDLRRQASQGSKASESRGAEKKQVYAQEQAQLSIPKR